mmetsp:Transcript_5508/g.8543  ORF Transcript_5508/g.8543 Transcript_5508/m.8543 type:complete len:421 (+) Transcript_5508:299-1561(+)
MKWVICLCGLVCLLSENAVIGLDEIECTLTGSTWVNTSDVLTDACKTQCKVTVEEPTNKDENVGIAFLLVTCAGLSTSVGAAMVFVDRFVTKTNKYVLAASLGFSGGVMLYVSFAEILLKSVDSFAACDCLWEHEDPQSPAKIMATVTFFAGVLVFAALDVCIHAIQARSNRNKRDRKASVELTSQGSANDDTSSDGSNVPNLTHGEPSVRLDDEKQVCDKEECIVNTTKDSEGVHVKICMCDHDEDEDASGHHIHRELPETDIDENNEKLEGMGILTAVAIALHNFPEGLATFVATLADPTVGVGLAVAIIIHNIPEGLCVSIPIFYATGSRWKGFWIATLSGVAELVGAALGYAFLMSVMGEVAYAILFGLVAGMMVAIVLKELLPTAHRYDPKDKVTTTFVFVGMIVMALSLCLFLL